MLCSFQLSHVNHLFKKKRDVSCCISHKITNMEGINSHTVHFKYRVLTRKFIGTYVWSMMHLKENKSFSCVLINNQRDRLKTIIIDLVDISFNKYEDF